MVASVVPAPTAMPEPALAPVRVWDLPTRAFHWALALAVVTSVISAKIGGDAMAWHFRSGYLVLTLLSFRLLWGLLGGRWSRFSSFIYSPGTLLRHVRGRAAAHERLEVGHSPTGALSVLAMLGLLCAQGASGLVADDEIANQGPLYRYASSDTVLAATAWHKTWGQWLVLALVALHVAAVVYYLVRKRVDLVRPMLHGDKLLPPGTPASADGAAQRALALLLLALCAGAAAWVASQA
jgi:cytochrome b